MNKNQSDDEVYKQAMERINALVDEVFDICSEVAEKNHYEKNWVIEQFRNAFNKSKKSIE